MDRSSKFRIKEEEELYYPYCSENKEADQLHSYCEADLRLWVSHMQIVVFFMTRLNDQETAQSERKSHFKNRGGKN